MGDIKGVVLYIIAISFQLSGALLLVIYSTSTKRASVIKRFAGNSFISRDGNTKEISYDKDELIKSFKDAWLNKIAFLLIASGYIFGIFGEIGEINKILISIFIIISTVLVMAISYFVVNCIIKYSAEVNKELTNDELNELGIEPNMESLSDKEIDDIWNEVLSDSNNKVQWKVYKGII